MPDVDVDRPRLPVVGPPSKSLEQLAPREDDAGARGQHGEHLELDERELDRLPADLHRPPGEIDAHVALLDDLLPLFERRNIALIVGGAYNTGILATGATPGAYFQYAPAPPEVIERVRRIEAVCARHGVRLPTAALQFPLGHPAVATIALGMRAPEEVTENVEVFAPGIPADFWAELKDEGLLRADAPTP